MCNHDVVPEAAQDEMVYSVMNCCIHKELVDQKKKNEIAQREAEEARIQQQEKDFFDFRKISAYKDVRPNATTFVNMPITLNCEHHRDTHTYVRVAFPVLHFLAYLTEANCQSKFYVDSVALVKYFVEEKGADISQKISIVRYNSRIYLDDRWHAACVFANGYPTLEQSGLTRYNCEEVTPYDIAVKMGNTEIARYLQAKMMEKEKALQEKARQEEQAKILEQRAKEEAEKQAQEKARQEEQAKILKQQADEQKAQEKKARATEQKPQEDAPKKSGWCIIQ
jgi:hypothetical protein